MSTPSQLARAHVPALHAYTPGMQPSDEGWIKLNTNECPYPPSPRVVAAVVDEVGIEGASLRRYPSPTSAPLREQIACIQGVSVEQVIVGNGSDDILNLLVRVFGGPEVATGLTLPSYSLYPVLVAIQDGGTEMIEFDRSMRLPVARIASSGATAFFLTSPNAPTGVGFTNVELEAVLREFPGILVVDEAYAPFAEENAVPLLKAHRNLVVVRTLSKAHALAGIRVGYALADAETIGLLDRVRDSYNVNRLSQVAAAAALGDASYYDAIIGKIKRTRDHWAQEWAKRDWFVYRSSANFLFVEPRRAGGESGPAVAQSLFEYFTMRKILVRTFLSHALTASFLRISVGTDDEMFAVDEAIQAWLTNAP
ncbi:MAG: histidinol-phosphate transaminase [Candidatus Synoicihabitans palmerolidicus]|nr:histidinol-phosphate transaminase [Candidatus Synoicihabitans palmerolidicus]